MNVPFDEMKEEERRRKERRIEGDGRDEEILGEKETKTQHHDVSVTTCLRDEIP